MYYYVAIDGHQIAAEGAVDVGISVDHEKIPLEVLRRAETEIAAVSSPVCHGEPESPVLLLQSGPEPCLYLGGMAEIAEVDGGAALGNCLRLDLWPARALAMNPGRHVGD